MGIIEEANKLTVLPPLNTVVWDTIDLRNTLLIPMNIPKEFENFVDVRTGEEYKEKTYAIKVAKITSDEAIKYITGKVKPLDEPIKYDVGYISINTYKNCGKVRYALLNSLARLLSELLSSLYPVCVGGSPLELNQINDSLAGFFDMFFSTKDPDYFDKMKEMYTKENNTISFPTEFGKDFVNSQSGQILSSFITLEIIAMRFWLPEIINMFRIFYIYMADFIKLTPIDVVLTPEAESLGLVDLVFPVFLAPKTEEKASEGGTNNVNQ